jgi:hypothetical protein
VGTDVSNAHRILISKPLEKTLRIIGFLDFVHRRDF